MFPLTRCIRKNLDAALIAAFLYENVCFQIFPHFLVFLPVEWKTFSRFFMNKIKTLKKSMKATGKEAKVGSVLNIRTLFGLLVIKA